jgi:Putative peptidoglycan binding domain/N-acetylmuramoyl-L-alanine amidase
MSLHRIQYPSPNYSARGSSDVSLIVLHTAEGATTIESLGGFFANPANEVSSHAGADDKENTIGVYVRREHKAWTQANFNPQAVAIEMCAFAAWDRAEWNRHPNMLANVAAWIAEEAAFFAIPIARLTPAMAQGGAAGVCQHIDLGSGGGGHVDCDYGTGNFPMDQVLEMAGGVVGAAPGPPAAPPSGGGAAPPFPGTLLIATTHGHGSSTWQAQMAHRGWSIDVDDIYGPASANVARQFQAEKGLGVDGIVGPETWAAAWTAPIT